MASAQGATRKGLTKGLTTGLAKSRASKEGVVNDGGVEIAAEGGHKLVGRVCPYGTGKKRQASAGGARAVVERSRTVVERPDVEVDCGPR